MRNPKPFADVFKVDCDLSISALSHAVMEYHKVTGQHPTVLWISQGEDFTTACGIGAGLTVAIDTGYDLNDWSVGTFRHKGVGSVGV